jgi:hypothetical protein
MTATANDPAYRGAILLTGYLGGAVATRARVGSPLFSHMFFGVYPGMIVRGGPWLRDPPNPRPSAATRLK